MLPLQQVGEEILTNNPGKFYVFTGYEYGIKDKYLKKIAEHYGNNVIESPSVQSILNLMRTKRILPLVPTLYVIRYDEDFVATLSDKSSKQIENTNIVGTVVCLYEQPKHCNKLEKYLPNFTVQIDKINTKFMMKWLLLDYPNLPARVVQLVSENSENYNQATNIARCMSAVSESYLSGLSDKELLTLFGRNNVATEADFKAGIAARNFPYLVNLLSTYDGQPDSLLYSVLSTMIELEKLLCNKYAESILRPYASSWTYQDIYNMFTNTYEVLKQLRSSNGCDPLDSVVYVFSLLQFQSVPALEVLRCN